ncbi:MAG: TonB-system energizer ExbB [Halothiobacillaceae bacterium]|nr:MAG: TonB-system energizer ExbB [Halothiobacillaceae bacterium]
MESLKSTLDFAVLGLLGLMSVMMLAMAIERWFYYRRVDLAGFSHPDTLNIALTRNLTWIYTVGANAPYVGLLGTVLGILITFYEMGQGGQVDVNHIMLGLALALKATAAGLVVAIPSIVIYNGLTRRVEVLMGEWRALKGV